MEYMAMMECKALMDDNYRDGLISRETYHNAVKALHGAFAQSNGYCPCICLFCTAGA